MPEELFKAVDRVLEEEHRLQCRSNARAHELRASLLQRVRVTLEDWRKGNVTARGATLRLRALVAEAQQN